MMVLRRLGLACAVAGVVGAAACSAPSKGSLVLAISTDMRTPKDINVVSVFITSDSVVKFDYLGRVLPDGTVALPATLAVIEPDKPDARIRIRVTAFEEQNARVLRDVLTTVPHQQTSLLRLPLSFLDDGSGKGTIPPDLVPLGKGGAPEGETVFDAEKIASSCDFTKGLTSINGQCASAVVDSSSLPAYVPTEVYGEGGLQPNGAPSSCFDVGTCFQGATPVTGVDMKSCSVQLPAGASAPAINLALVTAATGECLAPGQCYVPLENDVNGGWTASGNTIQMVPGVCAKLAAGAALYAASGTCPSKTPSEPVCQPTAPVADASAPRSCDGSYVVTCLPNPTCGTDSGGSASLTVAGTQATIVAPNKGGSQKTFSGTVDPSTCIATVTAPPEDGGNSCDRGGTITLDLMAGTTAGVPCSSSSVSTDGLTTCTQGTLSCTVARGVLEAGLLDAGAKPLDSGPVDAAPTGFGATVAGTVGGIGLTAADQTAATGFISGSLGPEAVVGIVLSDHVGVCTVAQQAQAGGDQAASSTQVSIALALGGSTPIGPGAYPVDTSGAAGPPTGLSSGQSWAFASLTKTDAACGFQPSGATGTWPDSQATGGTITLTQVTPSLVSGSFDLVFNGGSITGTFDAPVCQAVDLQRLLTTGGSGAGPDVNGICYEPIFGSGRADAGIGPVVDAGLDASVDAGTDAASDAGTDASFDAPNDAPVDGATDAGTDGAVVDTGLPDAEAALGCYMLPTGAVSWWRGEGNGADVLGNNAATWTGPASFAPGLVGQAFTFGGASYLASALNGINPAAGGTVEGWVQVNLVPSVSADLFGFGLTTTTMDGGGVAATGLGSTWRPDFVYGAQTVQGSLLGTAQWTHVAVVWAPSGDAGTQTVVLYVDGQPYAAPISFADAGVPAAFLMGGEGAGADLTGQLDEVTVYSVPLAAAQIQGIFSAGTAGKCQCASSTDCPLATPTCLGGFCQ